MTSFEHPYVIVVGIDFSLYSGHAVHEALALASARHGEVHGLHVEVEPLLDALLGVAGPPHDPAPGLELVRKHLNQQLGALAESSGPLAVTRVVAHLRRGSPAEQIAQLAADVDADLVVVGAHGRVGVERHLLGAVAERTTRLARCPVWVVRPKAHDVSARVPEIEPPCQDCVRTQRQTHGRGLWCARHAEHHPRPHTYAYVSEAAFPPEPGEGA